MLYSMELGGALGTGRGGLTLDTAPVSIVAAPAESADATRLLARPAGAVHMRRCLEAQARAEVPGPIAAALGADPLAVAARADFALALEAARVARAVDELTDWTAVHSVPLGPDDDIAHVLIGSAGVVVLVAPETPGRVWTSGSTLYAGRRTDPALRRALAAREDVAGRLGVALGRDVPVHCAVVVAEGTASEFAGRSDAPVLPLRRLAGWLGRLPVAFESDDTARLVRAARLASTWRARPSNELADPIEERAFAELTDRVVRARRRRTVSELAGAASAVLLCAGAIAAGVPALLADALSALH